MRLLTYKYGSMAETVFKLEQHSADATLQLNIELFLELILKKDLKSLCPYDELREYLLAADQITRDVMAKIEDYTV